MGAGKAARQSRNILQKAIVLQSFMKKRSSLGSAGFVLNLFFVVVILIIIFTGIWVREHDSSALRGTVSGMTSSEPSASITELLKNFFGIGLSPSTPVLVNPDPTNDCGNTINPFPGQCIAGQERCCKGKWICPNVLGQYICE